MIVAGDEMGRSQGGNNNAYAQDNETVWLDWAGGDDARSSPSPRALPPCARRPRRSTRRPS